MIRKNIKEAIKEYFFMNPTAKLRVREVERTLKLSLPSVIRYCKELEQEGILKTIKTGNIVFYTADKTNGDYLLEKRLFNIKQIHHSGLLDYIKETLSNPVIVLFGSYANGEDTGNSDLDLYIGTPSKKSINLEKFEKLIQRKIHVFKYDDIKKIQNNHLANNIINGITLNNYLEVFR
ncbi:MAG: nucleotidyltransferase domain-containing protein [Candidatus Aenigmarchaeota archaeon]|nr:nucleotidyltransferase domain-containing protein [Candidatus Aenigmarchaeota archaeon]